MKDQTHQHIDARSKARYYDLQTDTDLRFLHRFDGTAPEPRKGIRSGHIPGSKCVPFPQVTLKGPSYHRLENLFSPELICDKFLLSADV